MGINGLKTFLLNIPLLPLFSLSIQARMWMMIMVRRRVISMSCGVRNLRRSTRSGRATQCWSLEGALSHYSTWKGRSKLRFCFVFLIFSTLMLLVANLANTKWCIILEKWLRQKVWRPYLYFREFYQFEYWHLKYVKPSRVQHRFPNIKKKIKKKPLTNTRPNPCWPLPTISISTSKFTITHGSHDRDFHYILIIPILYTKLLFYPHPPSSDDYNYVWNRQRISALTPIQGESNPSPPRAFYTMVTNLCTGLRTNNIIVVRRTQISWLTPRRQ